jgi:hypothetical protein
MSEENVKTARRALDAINGRDMAAWLAQCDPELENFPPREWPESNPTRGSGPVFEFLVQAQDAWESDSPPYEYIDLVDIGNDQVLGQMCAEMRGKASGAAVAWSYWQVVTLRYGKLRRIEWFGERSEALEAVGLSE